MGALSSLVRDVEHAVASGGDAGRLTTLRKLTSLYAEQAAVLSDAHVAVFDEVLVRLAADIELRARVELSERLAGLPNTPQVTARYLARDDSIVVARPILERARLGEGELIEIALQRSQEHLLAISRRASLTDRYPRRARQ